MKIILFYLDCLLTPDLSGISRLILACGIRAVGPSLSVNWDSLFIILFGVPGGSAGGNGAIGDGTVGGLESGLNFIIQVQSFKFKS